MAVLVKTTQDGRKLEVVGQALLLGGKLEAVELTPVLDHPNRLAILSIAPDAAFLAGRVSLTEDEAKIAREALEQGQAEFLKSPGAIEERFRALRWARDREQGIE
jgi:hypothetical protein